MTAHAHNHHDMPVPRGPLLGACALVVAALLAVAALRVSGTDISTRSQAPTVAERALHFVDLPDGGIQVMDAKAVPGSPDAVLRVIAPGSNGFLRGALRALVRERRRSGLGAEIPFHLVARADGRLTLEDPATTQRVDLESFGPSNSAVFADLLASPRPAVAAR